ncbi:unnamed protein product [Closterium sp. NIES-53]
MPDRTLPTPSVPQTGVHDAASALPGRARAGQRRLDSQRTASSPNGSPSNMQLPLASLTTDDDPTDAVAIANPVRSHVLGARTGASLRGRGVNRRLGSASGGEVNTGNDAGENAFGSLMSSSDATLCREIAGIIAHSVKGAMEEQFDAFMDRTQELVEQARDDRASRKHRTLPTPSVPQTGVHDAASASPGRARAGQRRLDSQRTASSPNGSPSNMQLPLASLTTDDDPTDAAAIANPVRSHVLGARTGASLRGRGVNRRLGSASGGEVNTGNDAGENAFGSLMSSSDATLCREIAGIIAHSVKGAMEEQFDAFMDRTQELVEQARDDRASRKRVALARREKPRTGAEEEVDVVQDDAGGDVLGDAEDVALQSPVQNPPSRLQPTVYLLDDHPGAGLQQVPHALFIRQAATRQRPVRLMDVVPQTVGRIKDYDVVVDPS